jgi:thioredoxin reductase (NADPH)
LKQITRNSVLGAKDNESLSIDSDFVLLLTGYRQKTDLFDQLGVTVVNDQPVVDLNTMETNVPNVFIIGTAAAGKEVGEVKTFIENAHVHVKRVLYALDLIEHVHSVPDRPVDEREN